MIYFCKMLYYLLFNKEKCDELESYFIYPSLDFCYDHWSYLCPCNKITTLEEVKTKNMQYVSIYKKCSKLFDSSSSYMNFSENF